MNLEKSARRVCENCKWHDDFSWVCFNGDSQYVADFVDPEKSCQCWESKDGKQE